ncbi:hypothetical protein MN608_04221 [Microdochium nivale]|nr:hypothetical protein MN608_04221 [Microdochium nivale]
MPSSSRPFSTASPVHPNYLPTLHKSGRMEKRLVAATIAAVGVGYGVSALRNNQIQFSSSSSSSTSSGGSRTIRETALLDAYGDRGSLEELEAAVNAYGTQQDHQQRSSRK